MPYEYLSLFYHQSFAVIRLTQCFSLCLHPPPHSRPPPRKCSCLSECHFLHFHQWQMTVFISEEEHIFQAVVSGPADRHIIYDGQLGRAGENDMQYTFQSQTKAIQLVDSRCNSTSWWLELPCWHPEMDCGLYLVDTSMAAAVSLWLEKNLESSLRVD